MPTAAGFSWSLNWVEFVAYFNANIGVMGIPVAAGMAVLLAVMVARFVPAWVKKAQMVRKQKLAGAVLPKQDKPKTDHTVRAAPPDPEEIAQEAPSQLAQAVSKPQSPEIPDDLPAGRFYELANEAMARGQVTFSDINQVVSNPHTTWAEKARELLKDAEPLPTVREEQKTARDDQVAAQPMPTKDDPGEAQRKAAITKRMNMWRRMVEFFETLMRRASGLIARIINRSRQARMPDSKPSVITAQKIRSDMVVLIEQARQQIADPDPESLRWGRIVRVLGADPRNKYDLRYEVVELDILIASNTATGQANPAYPEELQPRDRSRVASRTQIQHIAASLEPDALLSETHSLDRGAMIVGPDHVVESGNARTLSLRMAAEEYPEQYKSYRARLAEVAEGYGIDPAEVEAMDRPVLVRRRMTDVDRVEFAKEANQSAILEMGAAEHAKNDAALISTDMLIGFEMGETQGVEESIRSSRNRGFVQGFIGQMDENARGRMMDETGNLSQEGIRRIAGAMLERVFPGSDMSGRLFEDTDNDVKNITSGIMRSLGRIARVEEMAKTGQRGADLTLAIDLGIAVEKMSALKKSGMDVPTYLGQGQMFERELTSTQEDILSGLYERRRSAKAVSEWLDSWVDLVERSPDPRQGSLFGEATTPSRDELFERWGQSPSALQAGFAF